MFKKLLVDNPVVLATFAIHYGLTKENVQDIENMMDPKTEVVNVSICYTH